VIAVAAHSEAEQLTQIEELYRGRIDAFRRVARAILRDDELARDAVQEGFARAVRDRSRHRGDGPLEAWVWGCVMNAVRDAGRAAGRRRRIAAAETATMAAVDLAAHDLALRAAVQRLPARQRQVLFLRHYADLDYGTIAAVLGIAAGTVGATLHAAHATLRDALEGGER
jgi:RNA polymerase sigma-70 factor (ECF subfamily)